MTENNNSTGMNDLVDYQQKVYSPFMDRIMKFLWKCGGADAQILKYAPYSDHIKNAGIGGVVLATTVMAMVAMGFAMWVVFDGNLWVVFPAAFVWGLIIFNLDRFIVSTVKGDGTEKITLGELVSMFPRLVMAVIIGLTISAPLETFIFDKEIQREWRLSMDQLGVAKTYEIQQTEAQKNAENEKFYQEAKEQVRIQQEKYDNAYREYQDELSGKNKTNGYGVGPVAQKKLLVANQEQAELDKRRKAMDSLSKITGVNQAKIKHMQDSVLKETKAIQPGFLDKLMMIERLSANGKTVPKADPATGKPIEGSEVEIYGSASAPIWLVRLLFMIVEIAPVIFKFMLNKSSYDYMQDNVAQIVEAKQGISLEYITDEKNNMHKVKENYNARRIAEVAKRQNELEKENAIHAITLYAEQEREKIEQNPEAYVENDGSTVPSNPSVLNPEDPTISEERTYTDFTERDQGGANSNETADNSDSTEENQG